MNTHTYNHAYIWSLATAYTLKIPLVSANDRDNFDHAYHALHVQFIRPFRLHHTRQPPNISDHFLYRRPIILPGLSNHLAHVPATDWLARESLPSSFLKRLASADLHTAAHLHARDTPDLGRKTVWRWTDMADIVDKWMH